MKNILEMIDFKRLIVLDKSEKDEDMSIKFTAKNPEVYFAEKEEPLDFNVDCESNDKIIN